MSETRDLKYTGNVASGYDEKRKHSPRWQNEVRVFGGWIREGRPASILDCPFGTGRWILQYDEIEARVIGLDISGDMLAEARKKIGRPDAYELVEGSVFDLDCSGMDAELIACIRLLNWMPYEQAMQAVEGLSACPARQMIVGCSVRPANAGALARFKMKAALWLKNRRKGNDLQYVHDEVAVLATIASHGWKFEEKQFIFRNSTRHNFFYRFSR